MDRNSSNPPTSPPLNRVLLTAAALMLTVCPCIANETDPIESKTLGELEARRDAIEAELNELARYSLQSGVGPIGYRSDSHDSANVREFVQINLGKEVPIDSIAIVPSIWRDTQTGFRADGFPRNFRVLAGQQDDPTGSTIASFELGAASPERLAPLIVEVNQTIASWVRIEAKELSPRSFDGKYTFQLSELMVFSGDSNVALGQETLTSSNQIDGAGAWAPRYLTDGSLPYLMDAAQGQQSVSFVSKDINGQASITIDLESAQMLTQINLHTVDQSDTVPQAFAGDFGFPYRLIVEGASTPDFSDSRLLLDLNRSSIFEVSPVVMKRLIPHVSRYIRLTATEPYAYESPNEMGKMEPHRRLGFAEIELISGDENVAIGKPAVSMLGPDIAVRSVDALTDGNNLYGKILPLKQWMLQLAKRHELELELPAVEAELERRYERQKAVLRLFGWIIAILIVGALVLVLINHFLRQRAVFRTKERIAADLHDELGANLHAIALLGDLAQAAKDSPEKASKHLERLRSLIKRTTESAKHVTNMLDSPGMYEDLIGEMRRSARRITSDLKHDLVFENEERVEQLKPRKRIDLFLFYNECLVNIIRHSSATKVETRLIAGDRDIILVVNDNGNGLPNPDNIEVPPSLKRRARLIGGKASANNRSSGGACITLQARLT